MSDNATDIATTIVQVSDLVRERRERALQNTELLRHPAPDPTAPAKGTSSTAILVYGFLLSLLTHTLLLMAGEPNTDALEHAGHPLATLVVKDKGHPDSVTLAPHTPASPATPRTRPGPPPTGTAAQEAGATPHPPTQSAVPVARPTVSLPTRPAEPAPQPPARVQRVLVPVAVPVKATVAPASPLPSQENREPPPSPSVAPRTPDAAPARGEPVTPPAPLKPHASSAHEALPEFSEPTRKKRVLNVTLPSTDQAALAPTPTEFSRVKDLLADRLVYPLSAIEEGLEGEGSVLLSLKQDGSVFIARIQATTGHLVLDRAAVQAARQLPPMPSYAGGEVVLPFAFKLR